MRTLASLILILGMSVLAVGCGSDKKTSAAANGQAQQGNTNLDRMKVIEEELRKRGISINSESESLVSLNRMDRNELVATRDLLTEFVQLGNETIHLASQPNISFPDTEKVRVWTAAADRVRSATVERLSDGTRPDTFPGGERPDRSDGPGRSTPPGSSDDFWKSWHACNDFLEDNQRKFGVPIPMYDRVRDQRRLWDLSKSKRGTIRKTAKQYIRCLDTRALGVAALGRNPNYNETQRQRNNIVDLLRAL